MTRLNTWQDSNGFDQYGLSFLFFSLNGHDVNYTKVEAVHLAQKIAAQPVTNRHATLMISAAAMLNAVYKTDGLRSAL